jgi:hypothetical protein
LFHELRVTAVEHTIDHAIAKLSQSDPLIKLVNEVRLGRMRATDPGLRAITEAWLETYGEVLRDAHQMNEASLRRLDPHPRVDVLIAAGIMGGDHPSVGALRAQFEQVLSQARP